MANIDKNIVITPNISNTSEPKIVFTGGNNNPTTLRVLDDGTLSFEGGAGQLFSISNTATGQIFAVNDISGYPLSEVYSNGFVSLARSYGRVVIGNNTAATAAMTILANNSVSALDIQHTSTPQANGYLRTPSGTRLSYNTTNELVLLNLNQLRFSDAATWSYDSWGGLKWFSANNTMIIGGPGATGMTNNGVVSANLIMHNATTGNFMVANASATNLFVGANGNVGIGNTTPTYNLVVQGTARIDSTVSLGGQGTFSIDAPNISYGRLMVTADPTGNATNGSPNANVGIGVAAPVYKLQVNGAVGFVNATVTQSLFAANGNVGIGNTTPAHKLRIEAGSLSLGNTTSSITISIPTTVEASATNYVLNANGSWTIPTAAAVAGGANTQIQYNNSGSAAGSAAFTFNNTSNAVGMTGQLSMSGGANAISFVNATSNFITWNSAGVAAPTATSRSAGTKLVLWPGLSATSVDYAIGVESNFLWFSADVAASGFKWYSNTTNIMTATTTGLNIQSGGLSIGGTSAIDSSRNGSFANVTIAGNLTVSGTTTYINTATLNIGDNIITLNADLGAAAPTENAGIEINRGTSANVALRWNETVDEWQTTVDGSTYLKVASNSDVITAYSNATTYASNASNLSTGTLPAARLSGAYGLGNTTITGFANVSSTINIGTDFVANTTALLIGNTTVNTVITQTTATFNANSTYNTLVVAANGNIGVGINPTSRLHVNGNFRSVLSSQGDFTISHSGLVSTAGAVSGVQLALQGGGVEAIRIDTSANVGIGNTAPNAKLQVTGTANVSGNVVIGGTLTVAAVSANGTVGTAGQALISNGTATYWGTAGSGDVTLTGAQTLTNKRITPREVNAPATTGTLTPAGDTTDVYDALGLTGDIVINTPTGTPTDGQRLLIRLRDNGTLRGVTWTGTSGGFRAIGVTLPATTVTINKLTYVGCVYNTADTFWDVIAVTTQV